MKRLVDDFLFLFQITLALIFGFYQINQMLFVSVKGLSISAYLFTVIFVGINTYLAFRARKYLNNKISNQTLIVYILGTLIYFLFTLILVVKSSWVANDTNTLLIVILFSLLATVYAKRKKLDFLNPIMKAIFGIIFRAVPHVFMALKIFQEGGSGLSVVMVVVFHTLTITRILIVYNSYLKAREDINRKALLVSEIGNELSWCVVTATWLMTR